MRRELRYRRSPRVAYEEVGLTPSMQTLRRELTGSVQLTVIEGSSPLYRLSILRARTVGLIDAVWVNPDVVKPVGERPVVVAENEYGVTTCELPSPVTATSWSVAAGAPLHLATSRMREVTRMHVSGPEASLANYADVPASGITQFRFSSGAVERAYPAVRVGRRWFYIAKHCLGSVDEVYHWGAWSSPRTAVIEGSALGLPTDGAFVQTQTEPPDEMAIVQMTTRRLTVGDLLVVCSHNEAPFGTTGQGTLPRGRKMGIMSVVRVANGDTYVRPATGDQADIATRWGPGDSSSPAFAWQDGRWKLAGCAHTAGSFADASTYVAHLPSD